jgi:glutamate racemase
MRIEGTEFGPGSGGTRLPLVPSPDLVPALTREPESRIRLVGPIVMPRPLASPTIVVFDSGLGGLTVHREIAKARPDARIVYAADDAVFPYGGLGESELVSRVVAVMDHLVLTHDPDLVVVACNTASTIALPALRARFAVPFVGTVPAIKPACAVSTTKMVSVLGTEATVKREYTRALIREFATGCEVTLVGSPHLAALAERHLRGEPVEDEAIAAELVPCFVANGAGRTDTIVLACTHYPLLTARLERLSPWPVRFIDPAPAIARRVVELVGAATADALRAPSEAIFTSGRAVSPGLAAALAAHGLSVPGAGPSRLPRSGHARHLTACPDPPRRHPPRGPFRPA